MPHQTPPEVDWKKIQEAFTRATRSSTHSSEDSSPDNDSQGQHNTSPSSTPIPSPNPDTDVEMAQEGDLPEHAPDMFLSRASDIITDSVIGVDQLHPPTAQHIRQDPNLPVELLPFLAPLGLRDPPGTSSGEGGIVIDTVADPRQRGPDNRLRPPQKCLSCQTTQTPEWRRGPYGPRTLCNACGLTYAKLVRDNNRNKKSAGIKELDSTGPAALSLSAPHQSSNTVTGPSYSSRYASAQPSGSGVHHAGASTSGSPIDVDLHERDSELSGEPLDLDAELQGAYDLDLEADEMDEEKGSKRDTPPPTDRTDFATVSFGPGHGHGGSHSQRKYHPHYNG